jgi:hypothetical protein
MKRHKEFEVFKVQKMEAVHLSKKITTYKTLYSVRTQQTTVRNVYYVTVMQSIVNDCENGDLMTS